MTTFEARNGITPETYYPELVEKKIRSKYTVSAELAILRQRDTKPDEYQAYFAFCEECKAKARKEIYN